MASIEYQSESKERLDRFLAALFSCSREKIQKLIETNKINVNNRPTRKSYLLKRGDKIEILDDSSEETRLDIPLSGIKSQAEFDKIPYFPLKLNVVKETRDFLIINKPAGLVVHPIKSFKEKTLVTALLNFYPEMLAMSGLRPGIVHRLDKDVSGLILVAKTPKAFDYFKDQFAKHLVQKEYLALVHGQPAKESGIIDLALAKKGAKIILAKKIDLKRIKESRTEYEVIQKFKDFSLLKVKTKTGRTHQIRIHLKSIGCPIVGDKEYRIKRQKSIDLGRIFLHSYKLGFYDLDGNWQEFQIDLPKELKQFLEKLEV